MRYNQYFEELDKLEEGTQVLNESNLFQIHLKDEKGNIFTKYVFSDKESTISSKLNLDGSKYTYIPEDTKLLPYGYYLNISKEDIINPKLSTFRDETKKFTTAILKGTELENQKFMHHHIENGEYDGRPQNLVLIPNNSPQQKAVADGVHKILEGSLQHISDYDISDPKKIAEFYKLDEYGNYRKYSIFIK